MSNEKKSETRTFTEAEFRDLADDHEEIGHDDWRHGHRARIKFVANPDAPEAEHEHYAVWICVHHGEGWQIDGDVTADRVYPVQVTETRWLTAAQLEKRAKGAAL